MIIGIGTDLVDIGRMAEAIARESFVRRVFTVGERNYCDRRGVHRAASYAARFAAKEAVFKAFGTGLGQGSWQDVEIVSGPGGRPDALLSGHFAALARNMGVTAVFVSLSHADMVASAHAILWGGIER